MKSYLTSATLLLGVLALWLWKIMSETAEPLPSVVQDMTTRPQRPHLPPPPGSVPFGGEPDTPSEAGETLFVLYCAACHGARGDGASFVAQQPGMPEVGNLVTTDTTPEEQARILAQGRGAMPAFAPRLTENQRRQILRFIPTLHRP